MILIAVVVSALSFYEYCIDYFDAYPRYGARAWVFGIEETVRRAETSSLPVVMVSDRPFFFPFYIYVLFYKAVSPQEYQCSSGEARDKLWQYTEGMQGRYYTVPLEEFGIRRGSCLLVLRPDESTVFAGASYEVEELHTIRDPLGRETIKLVKATGREN